MGPDFFFSCGAEWSGWEAAGQGLFSWVWTDGDFLEKGELFLGIFFGWRLVIGIVIIVITVEERCGVGVVSEGVHHHPSFFSSKQNRKTVKMYLLV